MASFSDLIVVGATILAESNFDDDSFSDDFSSGLDVGPANASNTKWSDDGLFENIGLAFGEGYVGNHERQVYIGTAHPSSHDSFYPHQIVNGNLQITGKKLDLTNPDEVALGLLKDYHLLPTADSGLGTPGLTRALFADFDGSTAELTLSHGDVDIGGTIYNGTHATFGPYNVEGDGAVLFFGYPMRWKSGMLHTHNRFGFGMDRKGRVQLRAKMAGGAEMNDLNDLRLNNVSFPALWMLQKIFYNHGPNGDELTSNPGLTYMPFTPTGQLNEPDIMEFWGYDPNTVYHTMHHHSQASGSPSPTRVQEGLQHLLRNAPLLSPELDVANTFVDYTIDFTDEKIGFAVNGKYAFVMDTPAAFNEPLKIYETEAGYPGSTGAVVRNGDNTGKIIGQQTNGDGSGKYMEFAFLMNVAFNSKISLEFMRTEYQRLVVNEGKSYQPFIADQTTMEVEYIRAAPLLDTIATNISTFTGYDIVANRPNGGRLLVPQGRALIS